MKIAASLLVATLAVASALPNAPLESRDEPKAVGATPVAHPSCALKDKGKYIGGIDPDNLHEYWEDLKKQGQCKIKAKKCNRVTCGNTSAIYVCNDNDYDIAPGCATIAEWVGDPRHRNGDGEYHLSQACGCGQYSCDHASGELKFKEGWRIQMGYGNCKHSPDSDTGVYSESH
ncbi:hypothetical protein PCL_12035 [Purpureocillium lilacinum]|uniref:Uncharacterized protein n=1 Tax=Purpureocillium lilacinum TaxID=33203 RepID=A0A2U3DPN9_PURLI|nr:hypothetical protein PCL_12035 [Purpureocillium lilacinum]